MANDNLTDFYNYVQQNGFLRSPEHAQRWSAGVLKTLGLNLDRGTKGALKKALPEELAIALTSVFWLAHFRDKSLSSMEFQKQVARRSGVSDAQFAGKPVKAVFGGVKQIIDGNLSQRVAGTLSPELRELWETA